MNPAVVPLSLGLFQILQKVSDTEKGSDHCEICQINRKRTLLQAQSSACTVKPCELRSDAQWDSVVSTVIIAVVVFCMSKMNMSGLAWSLMTPAILFFTVMCCATLDAESHVVFPVKMHPALL